jgi:hypothetical protein
VSISPPVPAAAKDPSANAIISHQLKHTPVTEPELICSVTAAGTHPAVQKNLAPLYLSFTDDKHQLNSSASLEIKRSSLLRKAYLFQIYPSHNFW